MFVNTRPSLPENPNCRSKDQQSEHLATSDHLGATLLFRHNPSVERHVFWPMSTETMRADFRAFGMTQPVDGS